MRVKITVTPNYCAGITACCQANVTVMLPAKESNGIWLDDLLQSATLQLLGRRLDAQWGGVNRKTGKNPDGTCWVSSTKQYWFQSWIDYQKGVDEIINEIHQVLSDAKTENLSMMEDMPSEKHVIIDI